MHLNGRKSDRTHLNLIPTQNLMLIPNLKSELHKNLKNPKIKKIRFFFQVSDRNFVPNQIKIFFRIQHHRIT